MYNYTVRFTKNGEMFDTIVRATNADDARNYIAAKYKIYTHTEFVGDGILKGDSDDSVSSVVEV